MSRVLSLCLITAFAFVAAACGANPTPSDDVADAGARTKAAGTARVETVSRISGPSNAATHEYRTTGVVDYANGRSEYREESSGCRVITIGSVSYSEYAPLEDGLPAGKRWVTFGAEATDSEALFEQSLEPVTSEGDVNSEGGMTSYSVSFGTFGPEDPDEYLEYLRETSEPERVGEEDVRGVSTTRYHTTIDVRSSTRKALEADGWKARNIERFLEDVQGTREIDVWVDSDGLVRRIVTAEGSPGAEVGIAMEWQTTTEFFDFGLDAEIQPPPAAEVVDSEEWIRITEKRSEEEMDEYLDEIEEGSTPLPGAFEPEMSSGGGSEEPPSCLH